MVELAEKYQTETASYGLLPKPISKPTRWPKTYKLHIDSLASFIDFSVSLSLSPLAKIPEASTNSLRRLLRTVRSSTLFHRRCMLRSL
ncbi:unnamed protein product, partial [Brassica oleracea]